MPRRREVEKRRILPDPKFQDRVVAKFINSLMRKGKKSVGESICYGAFAQVENKLKDDPLKVFKKALDNVKPMVEVKSRRVGGATYQVPVEIRGDRRLSLGVRWLVQAARKRSGKSMSEKLAAEFVDASNGLGAAVKRREDTHKMAEANRAFSHFKW
jgi:small subunit ribosomal protein S7